ncbi:Tc1-like transposase DDE domain-containing protein [Plasmodiophora brassicae]
MAVAHGVHVSEAIESQHAAKNTKLHALYAYYFIGLKQNQIALLYRKAPSTIGRWIDRYERTGAVSSKAAESQRKYTPEHREWIRDYFLANPLSFLDEAKLAFEINWKNDISLSTIWRILREYDFTRKLIVRRAIQIKEADIVRFFEELNAIDWTHSSLCFLDEFGLDNRDMLRRKGYALKGQELLFRGEFVRRPRSSLLCFIGCDGLEGTFLTEGTFDRQKFVECVREHALSGRVQKHPGRQSVWIMDGARIHCHHTIDEYLRDFGIIPIFLPAYCPMFNPIEIVFGLVKKSLRRWYAEGNIKPKDLPVVILSELKKFRRYDMRRLFKKCGFGANGKFNPGVAYKDITNRMTEPVQIIRKFLGMKTSPKRLSNSSMSAHCVAHLPHLAPNAVAKRLDLAMDKVLKLLQVIVHRVQNR